MDRYHVADAEGRGLVAAGRIPRAVGARERGGPGAHASPRRDSGPAGSGTGARGGARRGQGIRPRSGEAGDPARAGTLCRRAAGARRRAGPRPPLPASTDPARLQRDDGDARHLRIRAVHDARDVAPPSRLALGNRRSDPRHRHRASPLAAPGRAARFLAPCGGAGRHGQRSRWACRAGGDLSLVLSGGDARDGLRPGQRRPSTPTLAIRPSVGSRGERPPCVRGGRHSRGGRLAHPHAPRRSGHRPDSGHASRAVPSGGGRTLPGGPAVRHGRRRQLDSLRRDRFAGPAGHLVSGLGR